MRPAGQSSILVFKMRKFEFLNNFKAGRTVWPAGLNVARGVKMRKFELLDGKNYFLRLQNPIALKLL